MSRAYELLERLARSDLYVLIHGETGTGKEIAASALHHWSKRKDKPLLAFNCATLSESLLEAELFGYEAGAFTGAVRAKAGLLEAASGGTLFLDEIAELSRGAQARLLRALENRKVIRLGDTRERSIDLRVVGATHKMLRAEVLAGRFREDLYFRLSAATVVLPPLRDRRREIPLLARSFLADACKRLEREPMEITAEAMPVLLDYRWPGNVRELRNVMEYVAATVTGPAILPWHVQERLSSDPADTEPAPAGPRKFRPIADELRELERARMMEALVAAGGVQVRAAELISMPVRTFTTKLREYNLSPKEK